MAKKLINSTVQIGTGVILDEAFLGKTPVLLTRPTAEWTVDQTVYTLPEKGIYLIVTYQANNAWSPGFALLGTAWDSWNGQMAKWGNVFLYYDIDSHSIKYSSSGWASILIYTL